MSKTYTVADLFFTSWDELTPIKKTELWPLVKEFNMRHANLMAEPVASDQQPATEEDERARLEYGVVMISILRVLRKRPLLVDKINELQAVDCFNEITFFNTPWLSFPVTEICGFKCPDDKMHLLTFDQFIYALKEYYHLMESKNVSNDMNMLARLTATLYGEWNADSVDEKAAIMMEKAKPWQLLSVLYTFTNVMEYITTQRCRSLFGTGGKGNEHPVGVWLRIKYRLGESGYFQGKEAVEKARIYEALDYLTDLQARKEDQKK